MKGFCNSTNLWRASLVLLESMSPAALHSLQQLEKQLAHIPTKEFKIKQSTETPRDLSA